MKLALALVLLAACAREAAPRVTRATCTLSWNPVSGPVAGYRIYVSAKRGEYGAPVATVPPSRTQWRCSKLGVGRWFMTVTAFDAVGAESPRSKEIIVNVRE